MTSFYNLLKYAATGQASPDMTYYDRMRASTLMGGAIKTLTGVPPLSFTGNGKPLISWSMLGNSQQTGTPAPDAPIMPTFCGERTKNLLDNQMSAEVRLHGVTYTKNTDGSVKMFGTASPSVSYCILMGDGAKENNLSNYSTPIFKTGDSLIFSTDASITLQARYTDGTYYNEIPNNQSITLSKDIGLIYVQVATNVSTNYTVYPMIRLSSASSASYEPYGYKLPITCAGQAQNVYLGEVPTVRKVRKLVLDGTENFIFIQTSSAPFKLEISDLIDFDVTRIDLLCSHFPCLFYRQWERQGAKYDAFLSRHMQDQQTYVRFKNTACSTLADFRDYITAQYAAGTPVVIWYVLATSETAIVNEPLCKIGTYADELHSADAGVSIPTAKGANTLTVDTELQPSRMTITYR